MTGFCARVSGLSLKQVAYLNRGLRWTRGRVVPYWFSPDSGPVLVFSGDIPNTWSGIYFYRNLPWNRYDLVKIDTGNMGSGLVPGNMTPWAAADVDNDSHPELVAKNGEYLPEKTYFLAALYSNLSQSPCPDSLVWHYRCDSNVTYGSEPFYIEDLDQDDKTDLVVYVYISSRLFIFENAGPDSFRLAWTSELSRASAFGFGDFDEDGRMEFATAGISNGWVRVLKCKGDDLYVLWDSVFVPMPHGQNGHDVFSSQNLDGSNHAVLFVSFTSFVRSWTYLYMFEPTQGTRGYEAILVDSSSFRRDKYARSCCADVDGDGIEELFWSCGTHVLAYRQTGPRQFEQVWYWSNQDSTSANLTAYDVNGNGYNELIISGSGRTFILETEAIRVLSPNGGELLRPGDTCFIRWQTVSPPRCDSVALFLRQDTTWNLDTIVTGLAASDTSYAWLVPDVRSDSCRIVAIAYGPGWQYDESDSPFRILPGAITELPPIDIRDGFLSVSHNPVSAGAIVSYDVPIRTEVALTVYDARGCQVRQLAFGLHRPGSYSVRWDRTDNTGRHVPAGAYFCRLESTGFNQNRKVILGR